MSNFPRRSSRLLQHPGQQQLQSTHSNPDALPTFAGFSQSSSTTTTSRPSPSNDDLNIPRQGQQQRPQLQSQFLAPTSSTAPLPSPSTNDINPFFGRSQAQQPSFSERQELHNNMPQSHNNGFGGQQTQNQPQHDQHHNSFSQTNRPNLPSTSGQLPPGLPPDFLAEAAKRAQMACLMRDLGDVSL